MSSTEIWRGWIRLKEKIWFSESWEGVEALVHANQVENVFSPTDMANRKRPSKYGINVDDLPKLR